MTSPVHVGRALESLRNSNFDTVSAMGEVIDNSIEANATNIQIKIKKISVRKGREDFTEVAFYDDGDGMDVDTLGRCLQLGFSKRYNNRKGIGRFGVGMTLGAITQCTRIEVYSKPRGGNWNSTYLDLQETKDQENPIIPTPKSAEIPKEYADLVEDFGTLVVWRNWDREDAKIKDMTIWIGRTYRKFIGQEIIKEGKVVANPNRRHVFLDGEEISALDPLYVTKTKYNSEVATLDAPIHLQEEIHKFDKPPGNPTGTKTIEIRSSLLPEQWRPARGTGTSTENNQRHVSSNEGISILRNDREVFFGHIPYYKIIDKKSSHYKSFIDLDRFWGCEIAFDADLDHHFSVKNIKVGARPIPELREKIQQSFNPTIHTYRDAIRKLWADNASKENEETGGGFSGTGEAEDIIGTNNRGSESSDDEIQQLIVDSGETRDTHNTILVEKLKDNPLALKKDFETDRRGNFMDISSRGSKTIVNLNMQHPFFMKFFEIHKMLEKKSKEYKDEQLDKLVKDMETNLHLFVCSFVLAQKDFNLEDTQSAGDFIDKLIHNWTHWLEKNVNPTLENNNA